MDRLWTSPNAFRRVALGVTFILLASLFPLVRTIAVGEGTYLSAWSGPPGSTVRVSGYGFLGNETVHITFQGVSADAATDSGGNFVSGDIVVPALPGGSYPITSSTPDGRTSTTSFYIENAFPSVTPMDWWVRPGQGVGLSVAHFAPGETIRILLGSSSTPVATFSVDNTGSASVTRAFTAPGGSSAGQTITVHLIGEGSGASASFPLQIGGYFSFATPSAYYATPGMTIGITGGGFSPGEGVRLFDGTTQLSTFTADGDGAFSVPSALPIGFGAPGNHAYTLRGLESGAQAGFTLEIGGLFPHVAPSLYYATPGQTVGLTGGGFAPNETIALTTPGLSLLPITADAMGDFAAPSAVVIPFGPAGARTFTLHGQVSGAETSVTIDIGGIFPSARPTVYFALPGTTLGAIATGFAGGETVKLLNSQNEVIATGTADVNGSVGGLATAITIPFGATGNQTYVVMGDLSNASASFGVSVGGFDPQFRPSAYYIQPGKKITGIGNGFAPGEIVDISRNGTILHQRTADQDGNFTSLPITAPLTGLNFTISAKGRSSGGTVTQTIDMDQSCVIEE